MSSRVAGPEWITFDCSRNDFRQQQAWVSFKWSNEEHKQTEQTKWIHLCDAILPLMPNWETL
jgi:hypothetical protein